MCISLEHLVGAAAPFNACARRRLAGLPLGVGALIGWMALATVAGFDRSNSFAQQPVPEAGAVAEPAPVTDPAALAVLETNPTTPSERVRAILLLIKLEQAAAARTLVADLLAANLDDAAWSTVVNEYGAGAFIKISLEDALAPQGKELADAALAASDRLARDPARIEGFVNDLTNQSAASRQTAVAQLRRSGSAAVAPLVTALADSHRAAEHPAVHRMLTILGPAAHRPLIAVLDSGLPVLQAQAADVLGRTGAADAVPQLISGALAERHDADYRKAAQVALERLIGSVPNRRTGAEYLYRQALDWYEGRHHLEINADNQAVLWQWNRAGRVSEPIEVSVPVARAQIAMELTRQALGLDPALQGAANLYWAALIERDAYRAGLDQPLPTGPGTAHEQLAKLKPRQLSALLSDALQQRRTVAAAALAQLLGDAGQNDVLNSGGVRPSPLVAAAADDDRRVRFAALGAVVKLRPTRPFAGSSEIPRGIEYFIGSLGGRGAVVAAPRIEEAARLAGLLAQAGLEPLIATDQRGLFQLASQMSDGQVVLIHVLLGMPGAADALAELRRDPRTAQLPVAIVAPPEHERRARDIARHDELAAVWIRPMSRAAIEFQLHELEQQAQAAGVTAAVPELRLQQASAALEWLAQLLDMQPRLYDLRPQVDAVERALHVPQLADRASAVLGRLPSPQAQRALVELASHEMAPVQSRQAAGVAFAASVAHFGSLLTTEEMLDQYDRYNASEDKNPATQELLAAVLDALERGRAPKATDGQSSFHPPAATVGP